MKNFGLIESLQELGAYIQGQGKVPWIPFNEIGDNEEYLPKYENQTTRLGTETSACTAHGLQNQIETLEKMLYGGAPNYSERYTYNLVPINPKIGADPQDTYRSVTKHGLIPERDLPMTDSLDEYTDKSTITGSLLAKGQHWLNRYDFRHEWLWSQRPSNYMDVLRDNLVTGPIGVSVYAWKQKDGVYVSEGTGNNHWCLLYKFDDEGYPWVFDSYDHSKKKLSKDHNIRRAKRIFLNKKTKSGSRTLLKILQEYVRILTMKPTLLSITKSHLMEDITPKDEIPDEVACSQVLTTLMKELDSYTPIIGGTWTLMEWLNKSPRWKKVEQPEPGDIVLSPTGYGKGTGHCGVVMENDLIASNNSFGINRGKLTENYTMTTWQKKYGIDQGMPILFYRHV